MKGASLKLRVAAGLESGSLAGPLANRLARIWEKRSRPVRQVRLPANATVIGVGGPTLGGSGKTAVVEALARICHRAGASVAVVAGSYGARPPKAVRVLSHHGVGRVGDEALMLAKALPEVPVFVGKDRERAIALAAAHGSLVIVDSLLQTAPRRLALSLLVLDGQRPWGAGFCPPRGDLRARRDRLLRACDVLLVSGESDLDELVIPSRRWRFHRTLEAALKPDGELLAPEALVGRRLGLLTTVARPGRLVAALHAIGVDPVVHLATADHDTPRATGAQPDIEAWLCTAKCASKLEQLFENIPVWVLREHVTLPSELAALMVEKGWIAGTGAVLESAPCFAES